MRTTRILLSIFAFMAISPTGARVSPSQLEALSKRCGDDLDLFNAKELSAPEAAELVTIPHAEHISIGNFLEGFTFGGHCLQSVRSVANGFILHGGQLIGRQKQPFQLVKSPNSIALGASTPQSPPSASLKQLDISFGKGRVILPFVHDLYLDGKSYLALWGDGHDSVVGVIKCQSESKCGFDHPALLSRHSIKQIGYIGDPHGGNSGNLTLWMSIGKERDAVMSFQTRVL